MLTAFLKKYKFFVVLILLSEVVVVFCSDVVTFDECGASTAVDKAIIKSPNYPENPEEPSKYDNNLNCLWKVDLNDRNTLFMVKFFDMVTQYRVKPDNETVCIDYIEITTQSSGTEQFCGFTKPEDVIAGVGPTLEILFVSDATYGYRGFMLVYQAIPDHDPCRDEPCKNGACRITEDRVKFECDCEPGFTGYNCHLEIDECESDPCKNGATCEQTDQPGYECFCATGWQGVHCEIIRQPDPCLSDPCKNGGTCTASDDNEEFQCACVIGFTGISCRQNIDECESNPCENGGTCEDKVNEYECNCGKLYYGLHCEQKQKINGCREDPCSENGDCVTTDDDGGYRCECLLGWTGTLCETDIQECESNPCQNGGICDDTSKPNRFDCTCINRYTGMFCEIEFFSDVFFDDDDIWRYNPFGSYMRSTSLVANQRTEGSLNSPTTKPVPPPETYKLPASNLKDASGNAPPMCKNPGIPYVDEDTLWEEGSVLKFYCIEGYTLRGQENLTCLKNESWSTQIPECVVETKNSTSSEDSVGGISPWLGTMIFLSVMLALTLIAFVSWIMLKGPWNFGPNVNRVMSISQTTLTSYDPNKQC